LVMVDVAIAEPDSVAAVSARCHSRSLRRRSACRPRRSPSRPRLTVATEIAHKELQPGPSGVAGIHRAPAGAAKFPGPLATPVSAAARVTDVPSRWCWRSLRRCCRWHQRLPRHTRARHCQKWRHLGMSGQLSRCWPAQLGHRRASHGERSGDGGAASDGEISGQRERKSTDAAGGGQPEVNVGALGSFGRMTLGSCFVVILGPEISIMYRPGARKRIIAEPSGREWIGHAPASAPDPNRCWQAASRRSRRRRDAHADRGSGHWSPLRIEDDVVLARTLSVCSRFSQRITSKAKGYQPHAGGGSLARRAAFDSRYLIVPAPAGLLPLLVQAGLPILIASTGLRWPLRAANLARQPWRDREWPRRPCIRRSWLDLLSAAGAFDRLARL